jgi:hypothetical protein
MLFGPISAVVVIAALALLVRQLNPPESRGEIKEVAGLAADSEEDPSTSSVATSPFALVEGLVAVAGSPALTSSLSQVGSVSGSAQVVVTSLELQVYEPNEERRVGKEELLVFDSTLALVTAQERGISNETITEPLFEQRASSGDSVQVANVTLTRPVLSLDDVEIQIVPETVPEIVPDIVQEIVAQLRFLSHSYSPNKILWRLFLRLRR